MMSRLFIAFDIPEDVQDQIIGLRDYLYDDPKVKWEGKDKLHITAKFLGDTDESLIPRISKILAEVSSGHSKIEAEFFRFGLFYKNNKPKILWLGLQENEELSKLFFDIDDKISLIGYEKEKRKFKPHLTLLRLKGYEDLGKVKEITRAEFESISFKINTISLIKSELKPSGSEYTILKSFELS